ncbi:sigma-54 dependent transcriptional regulator [Flavobacteriales bacterium]|nr:sigma-54 dependent transcriptional regulator [Flavobacteriales bacterium]
MGKVLIIDDEKSIRNTLKDILTYEKLSVDLAEDGLRGLELVKENDYQLILCDIKMPNIDGLEFLDKVEIIKPGSTVVMISGHGNIETAVESLKKGAFDYIAKPLDLNRLLVTVRNALERKELVEETKTLKRKLNKKEVADIIGSSEAIEKVKAMIQKVGPSDARVLITGPNGSGKELIARQLHATSERASKTMVEVNCAAIPSELIESELFGHEKGAFTSAIKKRIGKFEQADASTLFLDEIGDMSLSAQAKVLRALQESKITRVGGDKELSVNVRVVAATNKNLKEEIAAGRFREDLYHRLSVIEIKNPALNDRREDIPTLINHFTDLICKEHGVSLKTFNKEAIESLKQRDWTGNIRELRNLIERLIILGGDEISLSDIQAYC